MRPQSTDPAQRGRLRYTREHLELWRGFAELERQERRQARREALLGSAAAFLVFFGAAGLLFVFVRLLFWLVTS